MCPDRPFADRSNACANTRFAKGALSFTGVPSKWPWQLNTDGSWTFKQPQIADLSDASIVGPLYATSAALAVATPAAAFAYFDVAETVAGNHCPLRYQHNTSATGLYGELTLATSPTSYATPMYSTAPVAGCSFGSALASALTTGQNVSLPQATVSISSPLVLQTGNYLSGQSDVGSVIQNSSATTGAVTTPTSTPGGTKSWPLGARNLTIAGTSASTPSAPALFIQQTGWTRWDNLRISNHQTLVDMEGSVGASLFRPILTLGTNGVRFGGIDTLDKTTLTSLVGGTIQSTTNALVLNGLASGVFISDTDIESNTNVYVEQSGSNPSGIVCRNCWIESNTNFDLGTMVSPVFDTNHFVDQRSVTGGINPVFRNIYLTDTTNFPYLLTNADAVNATVSAESFLNVGQHGLNLTKPIIGSASTPVDLMEGQASTESKLIGQLGGTLFGYSQPLTNLNATPVSQTSNVATNYWPYAGGTLTITTGQPDLWGGTSAVKVVGTASPDYIGSTNIAVPVGWNVIEMAFQMVQSGETIGLWAQTTSNGGTLDKRNSYVVPDTNIRVVHMLFKSDATNFRPSIQLPAHGAIIHRLAVFSGAELRPLIREGASYNMPFIMNFQNVQTWGGAAPTTGTWGVGDQVLNTAPAVGGYIGWVCITAGTPGTWAPFGAISSH